MKPMLLAVVLGVAGVAVAQDQNPPAPQAPPSPPAAPAQPSPGLAKTQAAMPAAAEPTTPLAHVEVRGSGPVPMVLIPGLVSQWKVFDSFMDRNKDRYTMYAVTLPGFGESRPPAMPPEGQSYGEGAWLGNAERAILRMLDERKVEKPVLVGEAMGGIVALRLAAHVPERFKSAVALNTIPARPLDDPGRPLPTKEQRRALVDGEFAQRVAEMSDSEWLDHQARWITDSVSDEARAKVLVQQAAGVPKAVSSRYMLEYLGSDLSEELPRITIPLLVIGTAPDATGEEYATVIREMWAAEYKPAPRATLVFFENATEFMTENTPAEVDRAIEQFLAGKPVEGYKAPRTAGEQGAPAAVPSAEKQQTPEKPENPK